MPCFLILFLCGLFASLPLYAASDDGALDLNDAVELAAARAPLVQAQQLRKQAAQNEAVSAGQLPDPELTTGIQNLTATGPQAFDLGADSMTMQTIGVMQAFPSHAKREARTDLADADAQLAGADSVSMRLAAKRAAATAWVALWAAQRERALLEQLHEQATLAVTLAKARLAGGKGSATDVLAAQTATIELDNQLDAADAGIAAARATLQRWIGTSAQETLAAPPDFSTLHVAPDQLLADIDRQGPMLGWKAREAKAQAALALAKAGKRPDWKVGLVYGHRLHLPDMVGVEVSVDLPLFPGNRQDRDISARYADRDAVLAEHEDARRAQHEAVATAIAGWTGYGQQVRRFKDSLLPLLADRSRTALALYRGGGSLQPWLDAWRDEIRTRIGYTQALAAWGKTWAELAYLIPDNQSARIALPELSP
ncbi:MAG TPA: TolC family protein [Rhodanobacteraceae bacterium]|nr:TolC family protein [Rhodanobacteraceae bacterium]